MKVLRDYVLTLIILSVLFFLILASLLGTEMPYTDLMLTIIAVHQVLSFILPKLSEQQ